MKKVYSVSVGAMFILLVLGTSLYTFVPELGITASVSLFLLCSGLIVVFSVGGRKAFLITILAAVGIAYINALTAGVILLASGLSALALVIVNFTHAIFNTSDTKKRESDIRNNRKASFGSRVTHDPIEAYSAGGLPIEYNDGSRIDINPARSIEDLM